LFRNNEEFYRLTSGSSGIARSNFRKSKFAILAARHFEMRIACFATGRSLGIQKLKELLIRFSDTIEACICGGSILVFAAIY
jgi:hypothetical protein